MTEDRRKVSDFEQKIRSPKMQAQIEQVTSEYGLTGCKTSVQYSVIDHGALKWMFSPSVEVFSEIVRSKKPKEIYYQDTNSDDSGTWGSMCIKPAEDIEIYLSYYIWGYSGIWDQVCESLGYINEPRTTGYKSNTGKFVLKDN